MAYQGEDWVFTIKGNESINLDEVSGFRVLIYPCGHPNTDVVINKAECEMIEPNVYRGKVPYAKTKTLKEGIYAIEVLIEDGGNERSIFVKHRAFDNNISASRDLM